ncbi:hypothetical protein AURDEDRAFT_163566 [Auricularia subglabra TFB-10046 SS5]|nr:hypothetical protein AURDEDRAFT_163566 [Auricularia subglabra TFB-10046 SS5]
MLASAETEGPDSSTLRRWERTLAAEQRLDRPDFERFSAEANACALRRVEAKIVRREDSYHERGFAVEKELSGISELQHKLELAPEIHALKRKVHPGGPRRATAHAQRLTRLDHDPRANLGKIADLRLAECKIVLDVDTTARVPRLHELPTRDSRREDAFTFMGGVHAVGAKSAAMTFLRAPTASSSCTLELQFTGRRMSFSNNFMRHVLRVSLLVDTALAKNTNTACRNGTLGPEAQAAIADGRRSDTTAKGEGLGTTVAIDNGE